MTRRAAGPSVRGQEGRGCACAGRAPGGSAARDPAPVGATRVSSLPSPRAPGSVCDTAQQSPCSLQEAPEAIRGAGNCGRRPGCSRSAARRRLQGAGQRRVLAGDPVGGPCALSHPDPLVGPRPSPAPWSGRPAAGASACARPFKTPAKAIRRVGEPETGPPPRARAAGRGRGPDEPGRTPACWSQLI